MKMKTYLTQITDGVQQVGNIDEMIGKMIQTNEEFPIMTNDFVEINIKGMAVQVLDIIRIGGLFLYCQTISGKNFALLPHDLSKFEEI